jgi:hypothetical protein
LQERPEPTLILRIIRGCGQEHTDAPHPLASLRPRRKRPRRRAAEQRDEIASSQPAKLHLAPNEPRPD